MITLADRKSRFLLGERVSRKTSAEVEHGMIAMLLTLPPDKRKTITPDRGKEFTTHANVTAALSGLPFYFPRPHAPWQRGTNENTNGLIREYFPRNSFLEDLDDTFFHDFIDKLNHRHVNKAWQRSALFFCQPRFCADMPDNRTRTLPYHCSFQIIREIFYER